MKSGYWQKAIPARKYFTLTAFTIAAALGLLWSGWLVKLDYLVYDSYMGALQRPASRQIVIVSIDDRSLAELGRWPWSRARHAQLIDALTDAGARAIALDLILAGEDRVNPDGDLMLAQALRRSGRVVLPVIAEQTEIDGLLQEVVPLPILALGAAELGHIDIELDEDGKVRRTFLYAGIGEPDRPSLALAMLEAGGFQGELPEGVLRDPSMVASSSSWVRDRMFMLPFAGPAGAITSISYADTVNMSRERMRDLFGGKFVLIGATASGLGEKYAIAPSFGQRQAMPGVEVLANIANSMLRGDSIVPLSMPWQVILTLLFVGPVYLVFRMVGVRLALPLTVIQVGAVLVFSFMLLGGARLWFPPMTAVLCVALAYPLWSWRRMYLLFNQLFREKELAQVTLRSIGDGVITIDSNGCIDFMNPSAERLTGWCLEEACGRSAESVLRFVDAAGADVEQVLLPSPSGMHAVMPLPENIRIVTRAREYRDIHGTVAPIRDSERNIIGRVIAISDVSKLRQAAAQLSYQATHDTLTDLPNRSLLKEHLERTLSRARRTGKGIGVLFVDLDNFKSVNDGLGHAAGDQVLEAVATRLKAALRGEDLVARQGGDEFVVVLGNIENSRQIGAVARKICAALDRPVELDGQSYFVTASIGISAYPRDGATVDELIRNADAAMYRAKEKGRGYIQYYSQDMDRQARTRLELERQLRHVHERGELEIHYQPIYHLERDSIAGVEALLRWRHPERGLLLPDHFLGVAEEAGLISELGSHVIHTVCSQAVKWRSYGLPELRVAINLSPRQLSDPHLVENIRRIIRETGMNPANLEFEITESMLISDPETAVETLQALKSLGVAMAIDDFGTGYSSLSRLKQFPVDSLKIDKSFVQDIQREDSAHTGIASAVIALAHSLKLKVVAEGVENDAQLRHLRFNGCDEIQGFYLSRPLPVAAMTTLLMAGTGPAIGYCSTAC